MSLLAVFLEPLGLGKRGGRLFAVHRIQQIPLFFFFEEGQLISRIESDFPFIHHIQQFGNQLRQTDISLDIPRALSSLLCQQIPTFLASRLVANLATS